MGLIYQGLYDMEEMDVSLLSGPIGEPGEGRGSIYWEF